MTRFFESAKEWFVRGCIIAVFVAVGAIPVLGVLWLIERLINLMF